MENEYGIGLYQDGVFYFTNPGLAKFETALGSGKYVTDWSVLWNNKEYTFKANTTVPLIISGEPPENIQNIRKKFAKKYAQAWFHQSKRYKDLVKAGGFKPATYDEDSEFQAVIQACLTPLPKSSAAVKDLPKDDERNYSSKAIDKNTPDLNRVFADYQIPEVGKVS